MTFLRLAAVILLAIAFVLAAASATLLEGGWPPWALAGFLCWCADGGIATPVVLQRRVGGPPA